MQRFCRPLIGFVVALGSALSDAHAIEWQVTKSDHFVVNSDGAPQTNVDEVIRYAEKYYDEVTAELGFTRFDNFWTWDHRAVIYLFRDADGYHSFAPGAWWSGGRADVISKEIVTYVGRQGFYENILVHEMGHLVFREFVGYEKRLPLWLDEGIATFLEKRLKKERDMVVQAVLNGPGFMTLDELDRIGRGDALAPAVFYSEARSVIEFLVVTGGKDRFRDFCRGLRDMPNDGDWSEVLRRVYGYKDVAELGQAWVAYLKARPVAEPRR